MGEKRITTSMERRMILPGLAAAAAFTLANRFAGGGLGWRVLAKDHGGPLGGRPLWYATAWLTAIEGILLGWESLWAVYAWFIWRTPGWYTFI
jgi:hypothetical protein